MSTSLFPPRNSRKKRLFAMVHTLASAAYTRPALDSFFAHTELDPERDQFLLLDNDASLTQEQLPSVIQSTPLQIHVNESPLSFAANCNQVAELALSKGADLYFLNNDIIFTPNWAGPLDVDTNDILTPLSNREVQYAASVMVTKTQHVANIFLTKMSMTLEEYWGNEKALEYMASVNTASQPYLAEASYLRVYVLPFFAVKIPHSVLSAVGRFDESFGIGGGEDFDYCLRAYLSGFEVKYALGSYLLHFGGRSTWATLDGESEQQRVEIFNSVFKDKWGEALYQLILKEDQQMARIVEELSQRLVAEQQGQTMRNVIKELLANREIKPLPF